MITVLAFGTFDGFHEGHRKFLEEAKTYGGRLVVIVAQDKVVEQLKNKLPRFSLQKRIGFVTASGIAGEVAEGDKVQGNWDVLRRYKPDVIALGYDQQALYEALKEITATVPFRVELKTMNRHE